MMFGTREIFDYFECSNCLCLQIKTIPKDMSKYYNNKEYYSFKNNEENLLQKNTSNVIKEILIEKRDEYCLCKNSFLGKIVNIKHPNLLFSLLRDLKINYDSKILDVGSGSGNFLHQLKNFNFRYLTGIDPYIKNEIELENFQIIKKDIQQLSDKQKFDYIIFSHSFEHMENPYKTLSKVFNILSEHGKCIISMPIKTKFIWDLYGVNWVQIDAPRHFYIFSPKSFNTLLEKTGFKLQTKVYNSTELQFWGSEQYMRNIQLKSENSYDTNPQKSIFSKKDINEFKNRAKVLNSKNMGDQAIFVLKKVKNET